MSLWGSEESLNDISTKKIKATYFDVIASGTTSGTITKPAGAGADVDFIMDEWGTLTDAILSTIENGKPSYKSPVNAAGNTITTTFDTSGNFVFSDTPVPASDHAVIYVYTCYLKNFLVEESIFETELLDYIPVHALSHVDGTDDIRDATNLVKGLATAAQVAQIEANTVHKTSDGSDHSFIDQDVKIASSPAFNGVKFNTGQTPSYLEGLLYYDEASGSLTFFNDEADISLQIGQEMYIRVKNNTGSIILNGQVCYLSGIDTGQPTIGLARSDAAGTSLSTLGFATHDIGIGETGYITKSGTVRDVDTSGLSAGDILYLSAVTAGAFTNTAPSSPNYLVHLGNAAVIDVAVGTIEVNPRVGTNTTDVIKIFNGSVLEDVSTTVASNGTVITLSYEKVGGGDLSLFFNAIFSLFDSTPAATVALTAGSDTAPTLNYVYIPEPTKALTASTTGFPSGQYVPVATVLCQSAASAQTDGVFKMHAWTDHLAGADGQGHLPHVNKWIRNQAATWLSGAAPTTSITINGGAIDNVYFSNVAGIVLQLHEHSFPAIDMGAGDQIYAVNDNVTAYRRVTDLSTLDTDSTGATLRSNNTYYSIVVFGVISEAESDSKLYCNLPSGFYSNSSDAIADPMGYSNFNIPNDFQGTGFLIGRVILRYQTIASGTITEILTDDLRGLLPSVSPGGGAGGSITEFSDNLFRIHSVDDATKEIKFLAENITTATTRLVTMPDGDLDFTAPKLYGNLDTNGKNLNKLIFSAATELTIVTGVLTVSTQSVYRVDTEADAATDDLNTISGGVDGAMIILRAENAARTVVLKDGVDNLELNGADISLTDTNLYVPIIYDGILAKWVLVGGGGAGTGDVSAAANLTDNAVIRGDGGAKGVQTSTAVISDDGEMTNPSQPAFNANPTASQDNIAIDTDVTVVLGTERFDQGNNFASNTFTAPVTGAYQFNAQVRLQSADSAAIAYRIFIITSNAQYTIHIIDSAVLMSGIDGVIVMMGAILADMDAGDTALMAVRQDGGAVQADVFTSSSFSGALIA